MQFSDSIKNMIAPAAADIASCSPPEISEISGFLTVFCLNDQLGLLRYKEPYRRFASLFIRKSHQAAMDYSIGRRSILEYLELARSQDEKLGLLSQSISSFEKCIFNLSLAHILLARMLGLEGVAFGKLKEWASEKAVHDICNRIKHFDEDILNQNRTDVFSPMWISDEGIHSTTASVPWSELAAMLEELRNTCRVITTHPESQSTDT